MKLDNRWKIYELMQQHKYISSWSTFSSSEKLEKCEKIIITNVKKILKKNITPKDFKSVDSEVYDYFYKDKIKNPWGQVPLLGPIGSAYISTSEGALLDLDDIEEAYVIPEHFSGTIKSETCGWISWRLVKGDKSMFTHKSLTSEYQYLVAMQHHKAESAEAEIIEKFIKYKNSKDGRTFKRFFAGNRFWFHDDLEKLWKILPYKNLFSY